MSSDELFLERLLEALREVRLDAVVVGMTAAILQGAPTTTLDIDLLIRDTPRNRQKLRALCRTLGDLVLSPASELASIETLTGGRVPIDIVYDQLAGGLKFASVKSRSVRVKVGKATALAAALDDVIRSKEAAGRPKDVAQLPILKETAAVLAELKKLR